MSVFNQKKLKTTDYENSEYSGKRKQTLVSFTLKSCLYKQFKLGKLFYL